MNSVEHPCKYCSQVTVHSCLECHSACCMACGVNICPLCVRVKLVQLEQAIHDRLVPWQYIETTMLPIQRMTFALFDDIDKVVSFSCYL
jgi:hypothetical protein